MSRLPADEPDRLGHPRPAHAADRLQLLIDGVLAAGATRPETDPAASARELAERILADPGHRDDPARPARPTPGPRPARPADR
ncbi:hypothetical protein [Streptomyces sp. NPDC018031]|uniref:hypothetical protein n=1 Tax=Streptomyces sp. NPDC018031 TaxID=3365033 RepID=UPI003787795F